ncbi:MAG: DUF2752 domain-containing protein [Lachnospiraceae bacterium]|nr:DUF2752 domain-containing protein [Lachnospiraceae bacterium]
MSYRDFFLILTKFMLTPTCPVQKLTGFYCPGCGGSRSVRALLEGRFLASLLLHPFPIYCILALLAILVHGLYLHHKKSTGKSILPVLLWSALALLILQFMVKNILLINGFDIINYAEKLPF